MSTVILGDGPLTVAAVHAIAGGAPVALSDTAKARMLAVLPFSQPVLREKWEWLVGGSAPDGEETLIRQFVLGHCASVGEPLAPWAVRAAVACRVAVFAQGFSGVRVSLAEQLLAYLDADVLPVVPRQGSVGAAGCPVLAGIAATYCGFRSGEGVDPLSGMAPLRPTQKEALSLINGSTLTTALGAVALARARRVLVAAEAAAALSFEVVRADMDCLDDAALRARGHAGGVAVAARVREALAGSDLVARGRAPDAFSVRCVPAVLGAASEALDHIEQVLQTELSGACDNPLVLPDGRVVEGGNFHAAPVALALDHLKVAMAQVAGISERRTFRMTYGQLSGLPSYLVASTGLNSGLMLAQYTAASRVSETKGLAHPASVDTLPTTQHHEDHVPMGPVAAFGALELIDAVADVVGIELICGAQGVDLQRERAPGARMGAGTRHTHAAVRAVVAHWGDDRVLHPDLVAAGDLVRGGTLAGEDPCPW